MDSTLNDMLQGMRSLRRLHEKMEGEIASAYGLTRSECAILAFLSNNPGHDTISDITVGRHMKKGNVSAVAAALEAKGLLERRVDGEDRRVMHLSPSASASPIVAALSAMLREFSSAVLAGLSEAERERLGGYMKVLDANARRLL